MKLLLPPQAGSWCGRPDACRAVSVPGDHGSMEVLNAAQQEGHVRTDGSSVKREVPDLLSQQCYNSVFHGSVSWRLFL